MQTKATSIAWRAFITLPALKAYLDLGAAPFDFEGAGARMPVFEAAADISLTALGGR